jgi:asparagine synthase (glutamine-hydrolysing)
MRWSIESRLPYLDQRLVELSFHVPPSLLVDRGVTKRILRESVKGMVPEEIVNRRFKIGFNAPTNDWYAGGLSSILRDVVGSESFAERGLFKPHRIMEMLTNGISKDATHLGIIWRSVNLELWARIFIDSPSQELSALISRGFNTRA